MAQASSVDADGNDQDVASLNKDPDEEVSQSVWCVALCVEIICYSNMKCDLSPFTVSSFGRC